MQSNKTNSNNPNKTLQKDKTCHRTLYLNEMLHKTFQLPDETFHHPDKTFQNSGTGTSHTSKNSKHRVHTLAQLHTEPKKTIQALQRRARAKYITNALILKLITLETPLKDSYWNTWHCNSVIRQEDKTLTSEYCNNRWCNICNRIRTAKLLNGYYNEINTWQDKWFVTLSRCNVTRTELKREINTAIEVFVRIKSTMMERYRRGQDNKLIGIRKIEVTFNSDDKTFHPHFHCIIKGRDCALALKSEWLKRNGELAHEKGQDIKSADSGSIIELFKYVTKIIGKGELNVEALDIIFRAMYGRRTFQAYGGLKKVSEDVDELDSQDYEFLTEQSALWQWLDYDWVQYDTGEMLSEYQPSGKVLELIEKIKK